MKMDISLFEKMVFSIISPKNNEKILIIIDFPTEDIINNERWKNRRELAKEWFDALKIIDSNIKIQVDLLNIHPTGINNKKIDEKTIELIKKYDIIIAMTEYSISSTLAEIARNKKNQCRCISMPQAESRMMNTVYFMDYSKVKKYAHKIKDIINNSTKAIITFSNNDILTIDLRNRTAFADDGDCTTPGKMINLPSGEGFIAPYEAADDEIEIFGKSLTEGILPFIYKNKAIRCKIKHNKITEIIDDNPLKEELSNYLKSHPHRENIAELGIGCNPNAIVTGNIIEDEKVGVHIAYGSSTHLGGKIKSDIHQDMVYAKGCQIETKTLAFYNEKNETINLVKDNELQYNLLEE